MPSGKMLNDGIAYLRVPELSSTSDTLLEQFASELQNIIRDLDKANGVKGWIVDLRGNAGGSGFFAIIAGLGPLLGDDTLGAFTGAQLSWSYQNGKTLLGTRTKVNVKNFYTLKNPVNPVAVLINRNTASGGELAAISFSGKSNVKFFGQATAGYVIAIQPIPLPDGAILNITSSYIVDRNGKRFLDKIQPDEYAVSSKEKGDAEKEAAIKWILGK